MANSPENLQPLVHLVINILFVLGEGSALVRLYARQFVFKTFGWDDFAMLVVAVVNCGQHAILYLFISEGAGLPQVDVIAQIPDALTTMKKYLFAEEIWYLFLHFWIKMSFLLFFLRLSRDKKFKMAVYITIAANIFVTVGAWVLYCLQCMPIEAYWYPERHPDVICLPFAVSLWLPASLLIAVDIAIFIIPLGTVINLHMPLKRRIQVISVITTGGTSVMVSCLRLIVIKEFTVTTDFIWEMGVICIVSAAEMEVAIVAANMPAIHALWKSWRGGTLTGYGSQPMYADNYKKPTPVLGSRSRGTFQGLDSQGQNHEMSLFSDVGVVKGELGREDDSSESRDGDQGSTRELTRRVAVTGDAVDDIRARRDDAIVVTTRVDVDIDNSIPDGGKYSSKLVNPF